MEKTYKMQQSIKLLFCSYIFIYTPNSFEINKKYKTGQKSFQTISGKMKLHLNELKLNVQTSPKRNVVIYADYKMKAAEGTVYILGQ
jgi:hypothetical protein